MMASFTVELSALKKTKTDHISGCFTEGMSVRERLALSSYEATPSLR